MSTKEKECPSCGAAMRLCCEQTRKVAYLYLYDFIPTGLYRASPWTERTYYKCPRCNYVEKVRI